MDKQTYAHCKRDAEGRVLFHSLEDHLHNVASLARTFADEFGNGDWGEYIGYLHDIGKFHPLWQQYINRQREDNENAHIEGKKGRPNHSAVGALLALEKWNHASPSRILAYGIAGHHSGLPDWYADLENRLFSENERKTYQDILNILTSSFEFEDKEISSFVNLPLPKSTPCIFSKSKHSEEHLHLWIRMLFSCLVDADFLDTEQFMEPEKANERSRYLSLHELKQRFDSYISKMEQRAPNTSINQKRREIRRKCIEKAQCSPGFFSLTVPTGGGKTLSSMAFALEHALRYNKKRIIVAIPYTSIIEQTAKIFKYGADDEEEIEIRKKSGEVLFGEDHVVEHHSNLDPEEETNRNRLACENWDAPIIVTTNVQLFESLFANKPSTCRKLHNVVNSIIILDEVQLLPPDFLKPLLSVLRGLVEHFGVTVVLMTATQPSLEGKIGRPPSVVQGLENVTPIIEDPESLTQHFTRVELYLPKELTKPMEWEEVRDELLQYDQVLCIVNSRKDCRDLHNLMPEGTIHLSALMCGEERSVVISDIKEKLRKGEPIRVISTQLVEAGVDIDFPVVYRALSGFDSIAQAAGRCNREGILQKGKVVVFVPPRPSPRGLLRYQEDACKELLRTEKVETLTPSLYKKYFEYFYARVDEMDKPKFYDRLVRNAYDFAFDFRTFAQEFHLIDDVQQSIVVWYTNPRSGNSSIPLIERLRSGYVNREVLRKLQRFLVNVHLSFFKNTQKQGFVEAIARFWVQNGDGLYRPGVGLQLDDSQWLENCVI